MPGAQCVENNAIPNWSWVCLSAIEEGMGEWRGFYPKEREDPACRVSGLLEAGGKHGFPSCSVHGLCCEIPSLCFIKSLLTQVWKAAATSTVNQIAFHNKGNKCVCVILILASWVFHEAHDAFWSNAVTFPLEQCSNSRYFGCLRGR